MLRLVLFTCLSLSAAGLQLRLPTGHGDEPRPSNLKLLLAIGDSIDRYMVDDWCDHYKESGSKMIFGQDPMRTFGVWSKFGKIDEKFQNLLSTSGVAAWKSYQSRICVVPEQGKALAFVFNPKGVDTEGPWWHQEALEQVYDMKFCGSNTPDCHDMTKFLGPAVKAITTYLQVEPQATIVASNLWDVDRMRSHPLHKSWQSFEEPSFQAEWKQNATKLLKAVREIVPNSKVVWHTTPLGLVNDPIIAFGREISDNNRLTKKMIYDEESLPGSHMGVGALNKAARELAQEEGIPVEEMEQIQHEDYRNKYHPTPKFLVEFMENVLKIHLP